MLQEMVAALAEKKEEKPERSTSSEIPDFVGTADDVISEAKRLIKEMKK